MEQSHQLNKLSSMLSGYRKVFPWGFSLKRPRVCVRPPGPAVLSGVHSPAASASLGTLLAMQVPRPCPPPTESGTMGGGLELRLTNPLPDSDAHLHLSCGLAKKATFPTTADSQKHRKWQELPVASARFGAVMLLTAAASPQRINGPTVKHAVGLGHPHVNKPTVTHTDK